MIIIYLDFATLPYLLRYVGSDVEIYI